MANGKPGRPAKYSKEFKDNAVDYTISSGKTYAQAAADLGVPERTLGKWVQARRLSEPERAAAEEAKALRREVERLRQENEFLKKPRPSSQPTGSDRALPAHGGGEGILPRGDDGPAARGVPLVNLNLPQFR